MFIGHYRVPVSIPGALVKRRGPDPPLSPCRINTKSKHQCGGVPSQGGGGGERLIKDLKRKANSLSRDTRQVSALGLEGRPRPTRTAPLGMTKTPTLRGSADLLDLNAATPPGLSPPVGYGERGAIAPVAPAFTPYKRLLVPCEVFSRESEGKRRHASLPCPLGI